jgi:hypothetical protein
MAVAGAGVVVIWMAGVKRGEAVKLGSAERPLATGVGVKMDATF